MCSEWSGLKQRCKVKYIAYCPLRIFLLYKVTTQRCLYGSVKKRKCDLKQVLSLLFPFPSRDEGKTKSLVDFVQVHLHFDRMGKSLNTLKKWWFTGGLCAISLLQVVYSLKVMELMAPYKVRNAANGRYLTASQQGILGLKTGSVSTQPYFNRKEQQWTLVWDPSLDDNHDGYRLESRMEYLNQVTTFYPDGSTIAMPNIWEVIELRSGARMFRNKRTRRCLQVLSTKPTVVEKTCSIQNRFQHWVLELLDLDKKIGERRRRFRIIKPVSLEYIDDEEEDDEEEDEPSIGRSDEESEEEDDY